MGKYYKTLKTSKVGEKFTELLKKGEEIKTYTNQLRKKYGFTGTYRYGLHLFGGIISVIFEEKPDLKIWKETGHSRNSYWPRLNTKVGKAIAAEFEACPEVMNSALNSCVGIDDVFSNIGFVYPEGDYYGFELLDKFKLTQEVLSECVEITGSEYENLKK